MLGQHVLITVFERDQFAAHVVVIEEKPLGKIEIGHRQALVRPHEGGVTLQGKREF